MKLSIVTLNFRKPQLTIACMESLYQIYKHEFEKGEFELIIVDNFSEDDSIISIKKELEKNGYKNCQIVENKKNTGFGAGNNLGVSKAKGQYLLFLNNDTVVKSGISEMLAYIEEHEEVAILGGPLTNFDHSAQSSTGKFYTVVTTFLLLLGLQRFGLIDKNPEEIRRVDWVKGALLMVRKSVFSALSGFDEDIFMYTEDMEFCYRAHLKGYGVYFYPFVSVLHKDQGSTNRTFAIVSIYMGILYFFKKHKPQWEYVFIRVLLKTKARLLFLIGKLYNNTYLIQTYGQALSVSR